MALIQFLTHSIIVILLTITTQIGGVIWLISTGIIHFFKLRRKYFFVTFVLLYLLTTFFIVPPLAKIGGRVPLPLTKSGKLVPHNYMTVLCNRHYVKSMLANELSHVAKKFESKYHGSKVAYLDANFPFIDGFPLLPHRSHDDGRKVDLSFMYILEGKEVNAKPAISGYGYYERPQKGEYNQPKYCMDKGCWQYDFAQYLTLGSSDEYIFDKRRTKALLDIILQRPKTQKVFIEPHLKTRLNIDHPKCRYHGCKAVRHDDHIHYQIY